MDLGMMVKGRRIELVDVDPPIPPANPGKRTAGAGDWLSRVTNTHHRAQPLPHHVGAHKSSSSSLAPVQADGVSNASTRLPVSAKMKSGRESSSANTICAGLAEMAVVARHEQASP
jgi:hypothetical protein